VTTPQHNQGASLVTHRAALEVDLKAVSAIEVLVATRTSAVGSSVLPPSTPPPRNALRYG